MDRYHNVSTKDRVRAFLACPVPLSLSAPLHKKLNHWQQDTGLRLVPPQNYHITVRFLGDSTPEELDRLCARLETLTVQFPAFECLTGDVCIYPDKSHARVMVLPVSSGGRLCALHAAVETAVRGCGFGPDNRAFNPHLTVGRFRRGAGFSEHLAIAPMPVAVKELVLMESVLSEAFPRYSALASFPLG